LFIGETIAGIVPVRPPSRRGVLPGATGAWLGCGYCGPVWVNAAGGGATTWL